MAIRPRRVPKIPAVKSQLSQQIASSLQRDPMFADVVQITTREQLAEKLNQRHAADLAGGMESVDNLIWTGAMVEHAIEVKIIKTGEVEEFVRSNTKYALSYVRVGRSFFRDRAVIPPALDFYKKNDDPVERAKTGWRFKVAQPTGVALVRDALKVFKTFNDPGNARLSEIEKLRLIDEKYPVDAERQTQPAEYMTANKRRFLLEMVAIQALTLLARAKVDAPLLSYWANPMEFLTWANDHPYSEADDRAQIAAHTMGTMPWASVDERLLMDFRPAVAATTDRATGGSETPSDDHAPVRPSGTGTNGNGNGSPPPNWEPTFVFRGGDNERYQGTATTERAARNSARRAARDVGYTGTDEEVDATAKIQVQGYGRNWMWDINPPPDQPVARESPNETSSDNPQSSDNRNLTDPNA
jgi:hypothetical protein